MRLITLCALLCATMATTLADQRQEFESRRKKLNQRDFKSVMDLAEWCMQNELFTEASELAETASKLQPKDEHAKRLLAEARDLASKQGNGGQPPREQPGQDPMSGEKPSGQPPSTTKPKKPSDFSNPEQIAPYVDSLFAWGAYHFKRGEVDQAKKYWQIILDHYDGAHYVQLIQAQLAGGAKDPSQPNKVQDPSEFQAPDFESPEPKLAMRDPKTNGQEVVPDKPDVVPSQPDPIKDPVKDPVKDPAVEDVPVGPGPVKPEITGDGPKKPDPAADPKKDPKQAPSDLQKEAKQLASAFRVEAVRIGSWQSFSGTYPHIELHFTCTKRASQPMMLIYYGVSKEGKYFYSTRRILPPDPNTKHIIVAAYNKDWVQEHGRLEEGRAEIWLGGPDDRVLVAFGETKGVPRDSRWLKKCEEEPTQRFGSYKIGQCPIETGTIRVYVGR